MSREQFEKIDDEAACAFVERARKVAAALGCRLVGFDHRTSVISVCGQPGMGVEHGYPYGYELPRCVFEYVERMEARNA